MHLLEKPIDYSKAEEFLKDVEKLTLEDARQLLKKLYEDNRNFKQVAAKAAVTLEQYRLLLAVFDGYVADKENVSEKGNSLKRMIVATLNASKHLAYWVMMLAEAAGRIVFEDPVVDDLFTETRDVCHNICTTTCKLSTQKILPPEEKNGLRVKNLERTEEENSENSEKGFYSRQSLLINKGDENTDILQKGRAKRRRKPGRRKSGKSTVDDRISLQDDDGKCGEEPGNSPLELSASTCDNDISEGGENTWVRNQVTCERRKEKTFGISYLKSQNLFKNDVIKSNKIYPDISIKCKSPQSTALHEPTSEFLNESNQSPSTYENDMNEDNDTFSNAGIISSKEPCGYKRKHSLNPPESNVKENEKNESKIYTPESSVPVTKRPRRDRRSQCSNTSETDVNILGIDESDTVSKRLYRSNKQHFSNTHESELSESSSRRSGKKSKKPNSFLASETEAEDVISLVKPKRNRRGRRKKLNVIQEQEIKSLERDESVPFEDVPCSSSLANEINKAYVPVIDVLNDPEAQHYPDVIQLKERKANASADVARCKETNEMEDTTFTKERNEMEALQEWNVLDAVSDEEDKEFDSMEGNEELSNNNDDQQTSDSDVEQEQTVNDDDSEQLGIDDSEKELDNCGHTKLDESCPSNHDDNRNYNSSDSEVKVHKKGPSTPDASPQQSDFEDNSDDQDENEGDADSVRSNEDEDISSRSPASGSSIYVSGRPFDSFLQD